jgi:hypothetical protein
MNSYTIPSDKDVEIGIECAFPYLSPIIGKLERTKSKAADKVAMGLTAVLLVVGAWGIGLRRDQEDRSEKE